MAEANKQAKNPKHNVGSKQKTELKDAEVIASAQASEKLAEMIETEAIAEAIVNAEAEIENDEAKIAKAGKRSAKSISEEEARMAKAKRKTEKPTGIPTKAAVKPTRSKIDRAGKKYRDASMLVDRAKIYSLAEAIDLVTKTNPAKFDASVEMHINLGVDPKQADQNVRDMVVLPAGTGKTVRIAVICEPEDSAKAIKAGADIADSEKIFAKLDKETIEFDVLICIPTMMAKLGKYARLLGPRGLMPNPKSGTVTVNIEQAVVESKAGKVEYRVDQAGIIHLAIGKVSFSPAKLLENADAVMTSVRAAKPATVKGVYLKSAYICSSMGPSIKFEVGAIA